MFRNILAFRYEQLSECERSQYTRIQDLSPEQKQGWLKSLHLDAPHEGRDEFFQTHWQRLNDLFLNHRILAELLVRNMKAFGDEGIIYLEMDMSPVGMLPNGKMLSEDEVVTYYRKRLQQKDARDTGACL